MVSFSSKVHLLSHFSTFETYLSLEPPSCTPGGGRCAHPLTFLYEISFSTIFIWTIFYIIGNFSSIQPQNAFTFPFQFNKIFETYPSLEFPGSTPEGGRHVRPLTFLCEVAFSASTPGGGRYVRVLTFLYEISFSTIYVTKGVGCVYSVSKSSIGCSKVCRNDYLRRSVQSDHMVAEGYVKPLSAIICLTKWGALQLSILSPNILQR